MNDLYAFFVQGRNQRRIDKWHHYFEVYERHLARLRSANPTVLEIGVQQGGSMEMWRQYFGGSARIFGIDIDAGAIHVRYAQLVKIVELRGQFRLRGRLGVLPSGSKTGDIHHHPLFRAGKNFQILLEPPLGHRVEPRHTHAQLLVLAPEILQLLLGFPGRTGFQFQPVTQMRFETAQFHFEPDHPPERQHREEKPEFQPQRKRFEKKRGVHGR